MILPLQLDILNDATYDNEGNLEMNLLLYYMNSTASIFFVLPCMLSTAQPASFNCEKAVTKIEKLICNDDELSKLDESLKDAYLKALNRKESKKQIIESQRQWLKKERDICLDSECIKRAYTIRIKELGFSSSYGIVFSRYRVRSCNLQILLRCNGK